MHVPLLDVHTQRPTALQFKAKDCIMRTHPPPLHTCCLVSLHANFKGNLQLHQLQITCEPPNRPRVQQEAWIKALNHFIDAILS